MQAPEPLPGHLLGLVILPTVRLLNFRLSVPSSGRVKDWVGISSKCKLYRQSRLFRHSNSLIMHVFPFWHGVCIQMYQRARHDLWLRGSYCCIVQTVASAHREKSYGNTLQLDFDRFGVGYLAFHAGHIYSHDYRRNSYQHGELGF